jgi:AcrR family transcriptional regulator
MGTLAREPGASMQKIAAASGVSRTTLHRAFGGRDAPRPLRATILEGLAK